MSPTLVQAATILAAAVASWLLGALWYTTLGTRWLAALGKTKAELMGGRERPSPLPFILSFVAELVMAAALTMLVAGLGMATLAGGLSIAILAFVGFVATSLGVNYAYSGAKPELALIDGGHWLAVLLVQGAIIGGFG